VFNDWNIPVIILNLFSEEIIDRNRHFAILRSIFVYINSKSERITKTRNILLNDDSVAAIVVQEMVQKAHDISYRSIKKDNLFPLFVFKWRDEDIEDTNSIFTVDEVFNWIDFYFIESYKNTEPKNLVKHSLEKLFLDSEISIVPSQEFIPMNLTEEIRELVCTESGIVYSISNIFTSLKPFADYINAVNNELSSSYPYGSQMVQYGKKLSTSDYLYEKIQPEYNRILKLCSDQKESIPKLLRRDVGMRAVVFSFSELIRIKDEILGTNTSSPLNSIKINLLELSNLFSIVLNEIIEDDWFTNSSEKINLLQNIVYDSEDINDNYRIEKIKSSLGALIVVIILEYLDVLKNCNNKLCHDNPYLKTLVNCITIQEDKKQIYYSKLTDTCKRSYRKIHRSKYNNGEPALVSEFNTYKAHKDTTTPKKHAEVLNGFLDQIALHAAELQINLIKQSVENYLSSRKIKQ